jgi:hypothetical protein
MKMTRRSLFAALAAPFACKAAPHPLASQPVLFMQQTISLEEFSRRYLEPSLEGMLRHYSIPYVIEARIQS